MWAYFSHELWGVDEGGWGGGGDRVSSGNPGALKTLDSVSTIVGMSRRKTNQRKKTKKKQNKNPKHHQRVKLVLSPRRQSKNKNVKSTNSPGTLTLFPVADWLNKQPLVLFHCLLVPVGRVLCDRLVLSVDGSDEMLPYWIPSAAIARWGALWSRRVWRAGWVMGPGRGAYQRAVCGQWAPHLAPCPLTPLECHLEPLQLHPAGIWARREVRG